MRVDRLIVYIYAHIDKMNGVVKVHMASLNDHVLYEYPLESSNDIVEIVKALKNSIMKLTYPSYCYIVQPFGYIVKIFKKYRGRRDVSSLKTDYGPDFTSLCKDLVSYMRGHNHRFKFHDQSLKENVFKKS